MRRPDRNIEVFSISVLDLFASALGAFIMCAIILYPYYKKDVTKELEEAKASLEQAEKNLKSEKENVRKLQEQEKKQELQALKAREEIMQLNRCHNETKQCRAELAKNFLMVQVRWQSSEAVNLHVIDADNNEFFWAKTNRSGRDFPKSKAQLRTPVVFGPAAGAARAPDRGRLRHRGLDRSSGKTRQLSHRLRAAACVGPERGGIRRRLRA